MQETMGERIKKKRRDFHLTQAELAKRIQGITHGAISQWESDTTKPNAENLYELSRIFKCDFVWLLRGEGAEQQESGVSHININESTDIPVFNADSLIKFYDAQSRKQKSDEYIMTDLKVSDTAFAVRLCDDSMYPVFQQGDVVIIDPQIIPEPGEFVLAKQNDNFLFRKYKLEYEPNHFKLIPLNQDYAALDSMAVEKLVVLGTMVEHRIYRRKR